MKKSNQINYKKFIKNKFELIKSAVTQVIVLKHKLWYDINRVENIATASLYIGDIRAMLDNDTSTYYCHNIELYSEFMAIDDPEKSKSEIRQFIRDVYHSNRRITDKCYAESVNMVFNLLGLSMDDIDRELEKEFPKED